MKKNIESEVSILTNDELRERSIAILEDVVNAVLGDKDALRNLMLNLVRSPFFIREQLFWQKLTSFLDGAYSSDDDKAKFRAILTKNDAKNENYFRLVEIIDRIETDKKIRYLINATRCLLTDFIDLNDYFRICHAITHTIDEDLLFLGNNIQKRDLPYSKNVQGLLTCGLMYQSTIETDGSQKYSFTTIAYDVDRFAVSYNNDNRYPNPLSGRQTITPKIDMRMLEFEEL